MKRDHGLDLRFGIVGGGGGGGDDGVYVCDGRRWRSEDTGECERIFFDTAYAEGEVV